MQTLDIHRPEMPDLQFALLVLALCTSRLTALNIPEALRTTMFDRCWVLVHDGPPPRRPEERTIDLRPWNEATLDATVETIRSVLGEAGIRTLTWDHPASDPTQTSTPEAQILINRLEQLYPRPSEAGARAGDVVREDAPDRRDDGGSDLRRLVDEMAALMAALAPALQQRAADLAAGGTDAEVVGKLLNGVDILRDNGHLYVTWARHYAAIADNKAGRAEEADESEVGGC
jgi:hypothetical protein